MADLGEQAGDRLKAGAGLLAGLFRQRRGGLGSASSGPSDLAVEAPEPLLNLTVRALGCDDLPAYRFQLAIEPRQLG